MQPYLAMAKPYQVQGALLSQSQTASAAQLVGGAAKLQGGCQQAGCLPDACIVSSGSILACAGAYAS